MFVPSLPAIAHAFQKPVEAVGLIVSFYLFAYGLGQVFAGSLSDSFGRRKLLTMSTLAFSIATFFIPFSHTLYTLLFLRVLQGVFAAGIGVTSRALLSDCYSGQVLAKRSTYYTFCWSIGPVLSPFLGGYLQVHIGWHASFYVLSVYTLLLAILLAFALIETTPQKHRFNKTIIVANYKTILSSPLFFYATLMCGLAYGLITSFNVAGPFLVEAVLGYSAIVYGHIALCLGLSWMLGNLACRFILSHKKPEPLFYSTAVVAFTIAIANILILLHYNLTIWSVSLPAILLLFCGGVFFPLGFGRCLSYFPKIGGSASAAMGAMYSIIAAVVSMVASFAKDTTALHLSIILLVSVLLVTLFLSLLLKKSAY